MDGFSLEVLGSIGPTGLLALTVLLVLFGKLVPSRQVDKDEKRSADALLRADKVIQTQAQTILELTVASNNALNVAQRIIPLASPESPDGGE